MKKLKLIFAILMFVTGLGIAGYPIISNLLYERNATQVVENYDDTVEEMDQEEIDAAKEAAKNYNEQLQSAIIRDENGEGEGEGAFSLSHSWKICPMPGRLSINMGLTR